MSTDALDEAVVALSWIASNADVPMDFGNGNLRLRQIHSRAVEALSDVNRLRTARTDTHTAALQRIAYYEAQDGEVAEAMRQIARRALGL